jgi:hypothetical protein
MENKSSLKYYLIGAAVVLVVVIAGLLLAGKSKPVAPQPESPNAPVPADATAPTTDNQAINTPTPAAPEPAPVTGEPTIPGVNGPATASAPGTPTNGLAGTWKSSVQGKGIQGSGKMTLNGIIYELSLTGDVSLVIQKVDNNTATGTITFNNACINGTKSAAGKPATAFAPQCEKTFSRPALMQIDGNKISWSGKSDLGADITLTGTFTDDSMSGTFIRTSTSGKIDGTFGLTKSKI